MIQSPGPQLHDTSAEEIKEIFKRQRAYFDDGNTRSFPFRKQALTQLLSAVRNSKDELVDALYKDFRKPTLEAYAADVAMVIEELRYTIDQLKEWMAPQTVPTPLTIQPSTGKIIRDPKGVVVVFSPWNYPVNLALTPLIGAIAAGNCVLLKPAHETPHTALLIEKIIKSVFLPEHVSVVQGEGRVVGPVLLQECTFNHIFFTGSEATGKWVLEQAAKTLTPVTLELGGKSPAIVDTGVRLNTAANRIAWAKFLNAGQTCLTVDYALVHTSLVDAFVEKITDRIRQFYGDNPADSPHYARIVNKERTEKIVTFLAQGQILYGGDYNVEERYIAPTVLAVKDMSLPIMSEEIFGPILPVITWTHREEVVDIVRQNRYPLACYIFSENQKNIDYWLERIEFGGGCINDAIIHYTNPAFPFGGVMTSGMGRYHGRHTFDTFSNTKPVLQSVSLVDTHVWYPPYTDLKTKLVKNLIK